MPDLDRGPAGPLHRREGKQSSTAMKPKHFALDAVDVSHTIDTGRSRRIGSAKVTDLRRGELTLTHRPTGLSVSGAIEEGHYTNSQFTARRIALEGELWGRLTALVAKKLKAPNRTP